MEGLNERVRERERGVFLSIRQCVCESMHHERERERERGTEREPDGSKASSSDPEGMVGFIRAS